MAAAWWRITVLMPCLVCMLLHAPAPAQVLFVLPHRWNGQTLRPDAAAQRGLGPLQPGMLSSGKGMPYGAIDQLTSTLQGEHREHAGGTQLGSISNAAFGLMLQKHRAHCTMHA